MPTAYALVALNILCIVVCYQVGGQAQTPTRAFGGLWACFLALWPYPFCSSLSQEINNMSGETELKIYTAVAVTAVTR